MYGSYFTFSPSGSQSSSPAGSIYSTYSSYSISDAPSSAQSSNEPSCAFPSWPRRSSLGGVATEAAATSFISDDDLFPVVFDDNEADCTPLTSPCRSPLITSMREPQLMSPETFREFLVSASGTKEEKRPKTTKRRRSSRKSSSARSTTRAMSPIKEVE